MTTQSSLKRRLFVVLRWWPLILIVGVGVSFVAFMIAVGGLRIYSPHDEMEELLQEFEPPPDSTLVEIDKAGERLCFIQCIAWKVRYFYTYDGDRPLCEVLSGPAEEWFGRPSLPIPNPRDPPHCSFYVSDTDSDERWCASVRTIDELYGSSQIGDYVVGLRQEC